MLDVRKDKRQTKSEEWSPVQRTGNREEHIPNRQSGEDEKNKPALAIQIGISQEKLVLKLNGNRELGDRKPETV